MGHVTQDASSLNWIIKSPNLSYSSRIPIIVHRERCLYPKVIHPSRRAQGRSDELPEGGISARKHSLGWAIQIYLSRSSMYKLKEVNPAVSGWHNFPFAKDTVILFLVILSYLLVCSRVESEGQGGSKGTHGLRKQSLVSIGVHKTCIKRCCQVCIQKALSAVVMLPRGFQPNRELYGPA